jgi:hypothetical protein
MCDLTKLLLGTFPTEAEIMTCIRINLLPFKEQLFEGEEACAAVACEPWKTTGGGRGDDEDWGIDWYVFLHDEAQKVINLTDGKDEESSGLEDSNTSYDGKNMAFEGKPSTTHLAHLQETLVEPWREICWLTLSTYLTYVLETLEDWWRATCWALTLWHHKKSMKSLLTCNSLLPSKHATLRLKPLGVLSGKIPQSKKF